MKEFFNKCKNLYFNCVDYLKANKTLAWILIGAAALIVLVIIVAIVASCAKRSKKKKAAKSATAQTAKTPTASPTNVKASVAVADDKAAQAKADKEKAAAEEKARRMAVLARLEAEEKAAEAEELAKKQAEEKAKAEKEQAEKAAVKATEKAPTKKAATKPTAKKATEKTEVKEEKPAPVKKTEAKKAEPKATEKAKPAATESKPAAKKTAAKPAVKAPVEDQSGGKYNGKWSIFRVLTSGEEEEMYYFELRASNGEKLLSSEEYTSHAGVLRGIETHKANIEKGNFKITLSKKGDYIFKLLNGKNTLLCTGENYKTLMRCESAIESTKRFAKTAVIDDVVQDKVIKLPVEDDTEVLELADGYNGKWIISSYDGANGEKLYYFELFANNGEKLLSSEEYTTYIGAVNGIQTHKTNIEKGNFRISLTKRGDYIYKLLNGNGQLLCLGEHYKTKHRCQNAVESVKRFAKNSPVLTEETNL